VNSREWLHTPGDAGYHDTSTLDDDVDEAYQEEELSPSFVVDPGAGLNDLVGDADDIEMSIVVKQKMKTNKEKKLGCLDQGLDYQIMILMNFELSTSITFICHFFHFISLMNICIPF
jgi:hypothetical protein